jgi:energy-converting hydrogenase Eha subunit F
MLALPPLAAEPIFYIGTFPVVNTYINSTLTLIAFVIIAWLIKQAADRYYGRIFHAPRGLLNFF